MTPRPTLAAHAETLHQALLRAVPLDARAIFVVGRDAGQLGAILKQRDAECKVFGIASEPTSGSGQGLDRFFTLDFEKEDPPLGCGEIDCVLYGPAELERLGDPASVLRRHRSFLIANGCIVSAVSNAQHLSVLASFLRGDFPGTTAGRGVSPLHSFTWSSFTKLLLDAGYAPEIVATVATPRPTVLLEAARPLIAALNLHAETTFRHLSADDFVFRGRPVSYLGESGRTDEEAVPPLTFVVCVADERVLQANLLSSPCLAPESPHEVILQRNCTSAADGLNRGLEAAKNPLVICVHQDVYLPAGWTRQFWQQYQLAEARWGNIGVAGVYGVTRRQDSTIRAGHVVDRIRLLKEPSDLPANAETLDELLLAVKKDAGLRFDERFGFHFYGADLCLAMAQKGLKVVALDALCFHNTANVNLPSEFMASGRAFAGKWADHLPVATSCVRVDRSWLGPALALKPPEENPDTPPANDQLASILILCCNQLDYTRLCLDSVLQQTRAPYELIIVDNGSTDGTTEYLHEFRSRPGPQRIEIIRNDTNLGYPAGCNQALAQARGRFIVFLNNDTVVTPAWLDGLIACSLHDWPRNGMVGAVTNYSRPPQQIAVDYADLSGLQPFALRRRQQFRGQAIPVNRLTGFCLLVRRDVLQQIGGYDEQFGLGFFDDDDLSVRALRAGYRLAVALDVFIHHFGSRTFTGLGIDCTKQLNENFQRFRDKWGEQEAAGYRTPAATERSAQSARPPNDSRPRVSLCMIVKNEEANLQDCLQGLSDLFDEIIVVDTGSSDRTKEVAHGLGAKLFDFPWVDSFAAARNESVSHATGDWVFWLDGDDRLDDANRQKLRELFRTLPTGEMVGYSMKCVCLPDPIHKTVTVVDHIRLFPNHPQVRWHYRVHEQILPSIRRLGGQVRWADVVIQHTGYQDPALRGRKLQRDIRLLQLEDQEHPDDPFTLFNLGSVYQELGRFAEAIPLLRRSLERSQPSDSIVRKLYALIAQSHRHLQQHREALATCQEGRRYYPDDAELIFQESLVRRETGDLKGAETCLVRLLNGQEGAHFASVDAGLRGYKARHNLAVVYQEQGRLAEAESQWQAVLAEQPDYVAALIGLGEVCLSTQRWQELESTTRQLEQSSAGMEAAVLRARSHLVRKDFPQARQILEEVIAGHPQALWPRRILSHVLLQEGKDWVAAERALREVLAMAPENQEARNNLRILMEQKQRS